MLQLVQLVFKPTGRAKTLQTWELFTEPRLQVIILTNNHTQTFPFYVFTLLPFDVDRIDRTSFSWSAVPEGLFCNKYWILGKDIRQEKEPTGKQNQVLNARTKFKINLTLVFPSIWKTLKPCIGNCRIIAKSGSVLEKVSAQQHCSPPDMSLISSFPPLLLFELQSEKASRAGIASFKEPSLSALCHDYAILAATLLADSKALEIASPQFSLQPLQLQPAASFPLEIWANPEWPQLSEKWSHLGNNSIVVGRLGWWHKSKIK